MVSTSRVQLLTSDIVLYGQYGANNMLRPEGYTASFLLVQDEVGGHEVTLGTNNVGNIAVGQQPNEATVLSFVIYQHKAYWFSALVNTSPLAEATLQDIEAAIIALKGGVPTQGDTLNKLYQLHQNLQQQVNNLGSGTQTPIMLTVTSNGQTTWNIGGSETRVLLFLNGVRMNRGEDYVITLPLLTWTSSTVQIEIGDELILT